jgi:O-antigen/teichoic acid export membrane protein
MIIGFFFFIGIVTCMDDLFKLTSRYEELSKGKEVIWFLGTAKVFSMSLGINNYILNLSRYYKLSMLTFLVMALTNVALNFICIPKFQIAGAAMATSFSLITFSLLSAYLVWTKLGIRPVSSRVLIVTLLAIPSILLGQVLPDFGHPIANIIIKGLIVSVLFLAPVLGFRISPDLNRFVSKYLNLFLHRSRNFFKY